MSVEKMATSPHFVDKLVDKVPSFLESSLKCL